MVMAGIMVIVYMIVCCDSLDGHGDYDGRRGDWSDHGHYG
jgi:hypothetical protein